LNPVVSASFVSAHNNTTLMPRAPASHASRQRRRQQSITRCLDWLAPDAKATICLGIAPSTRVSDKSD
jgi:hypothetical protein